MIIRTFQTIAGVLELRFPYPQAMYIQEWQLNGHPILDDDSEFTPIMRSVENLVADTLIALTTGGTPPLSEGIVELIPVEECVNLLPRYRNAWEALHQQDAEILAQWPNAYGLIDQIGRVSGDMGLLSARIGK